VRRVSSLALFLFCFLGVESCALTAAAKQNKEQPRTLVQFDEASLSKGSVEFQRGVFRIEDAGLRVTNLCIPVKGKWRHVGDMHDCGNQPLTAQRREILQFSPDRTVLGIRNLGVSTEQWDLIQKLDKPKNPENALLKVGEAFSFNIGSTAISWCFDSQKLPEELKKPIPGSGIHVHLGGFFSKGHELPLLEPKSGDFKVELKLSIPTFVRSGRAVSGVSVAIDLDIKTEGGSDVTVPLIVSLFSQNINNHEGVASDGRVNFVSSYLGAGSKYIQRIENDHRSVPWPGFDLFAFKLTRENIKNILKDMNARRRTSGAVLLDEKHLEQIRVSGVTLRNESRFLDEGELEIKVAVDYIKVMREY
jgi:hypothetical protein